MAYPGRITGRSRRWSLGLVGGALLWAAPAAAAKNGPALFLLPVERALPISDSAAQVFEERLAIAVGDTHRVRVLSARDVPDERRAELPADLTACVSPSCLKRLGEIAGADRVLQSKLADDAGWPTLFATLYDAGTGAILQRREWPARAGEPPPSPRLAGDVARWIVGDPAPPLAPAPRAPAPAALVAPGVVALDLADGEPDSPQAQALMSQLSARLGGRRGFAIVLGHGAPGAGCTHRAAVRIEALHVSVRPHHASHAREGALAAALTITELPSERVVFAARGEAQGSVKARKSNDAEVMAVLVTEVVDQWVNAFDAQSVERQLHRRPEMTGESMKERP
jgi:hypothetical protein